MSSTKVSKEEREEIDLGTKKFFKYNSPVKELELKKTVLKGRSPENPEKVYVETESFALFIIEGDGIISLDGSEYELSSEDVVYVEKGTKWWIEGELEYIVFNTPQWYPEQMQEVDV